MANIKDLIQSIESGDSSFDEKLAAINAMEETLVAMRAQEQSAIDDNVAMIVEAIAVMQRKVEAQLEVAKAIVPEIGPRGPKGEPGDRGLDGANGRDGRDGADGRNGVDGQDGVSVTDAKIDFDGSLVITLSTGREINVGEVVAPDLAEKIKLVTSGGGTSQQVLDTLASLQTQIDTLIPSQTGNAGKYLTTDGTSTSWATVAGGGAVDSVNGQTGVVVLDAADVGALPTTGGTVTGPTVVAMSSTSTALRVTQTGTGNALVVEDAANPDSSPFVVTSTGLVGIRNSAPAVALDVVGAAQISQTLAVLGSTFEVDSGNAYIQSTAGTTYFGSASNLILEAGIATAIEASGTTQNVGIGVAPNTSKLAVGGVVESTTGGFKFPDATTQTTAASALTVQDEGTTLTSAATSLNFTGAGVTATNSGGAVTVAITGGGGGISSADIQEFTTAGSSTWTKPAGAKIVYVLMFGGGGGGGSGRRRATASVATAASGGGGGGGGGRTELWIPAAALGSTETVTVGAGGTGGVAATVDDTNGNSGFAGDNSLFGSWALARAASGGSGGATTTASGGTGAGGLGEFVTGSTGHSASGGSGTTTIGTSGNRGGYRPGGGGGGGGFSAASTTAQSAGTGGLGGALFSTSTSSIAGGGGAGAANTSGSNGPNSTTYFVGGSGGGGGGSSTTTAGSGGNGGYPGGAGGGGGAGHGVNSGAGGNGGNGYIRVVTFF